MKDLINVENLEKILSAKWAEFLDVRKIIAFTRQIATERLKLESTNSVSVSRFEITEGGFVLWIEFNTEEGNKTIEAFLSNTGLLHYLDHI